MSKIIKYTTVDDYKVQEYIDNGWQPWGSLAYGGEGVPMVQAMVVYAFEVDNG